MPLSVLFEILINLLFFKFFTFGEKLTFLIITVVKDAAWEHLAGSVSEHSTLDLGDSSLSTSWR